MATPASLRRPKARKQRLRRRPQPLSVTFVCYGNACRSQMAEAWARHYGAEHVLAQSAGVHPLGEVTLETQVVMAEKGVSLEGHYSKGLDAIDWGQVDAVVNMTPYPTAALVSGFSGRRVTWKVADPFLESVNFYRTIRDELERRVRVLIEELRGDQSRATETV